VIDFKIELSKKGKNEIKIGGGDREGRLEEKEGRGGKEKTQLKK